MLVAVFVFAVTVVVSIALPLSSKFLHDSITSSIPVCIVSTLILTFDPSKQLQKKNKKMRHPQSLGDGKPTKRIAS